jgi:hypothetical protein
MSPQTLEPCPLNVTCSSPTPRSLKIESDIPIPWSPTLSYYRSALLSMKKGDSFLCAKSDRELVRAAAKSAQCDIHIEVENVRVWVTNPPTFGFGEGFLSEWRSGIESPRLVTAAELAPLVDLPARSLGKILSQMSRAGSSGVTVYKFNSKRGHTYRIEPL